MHIEKHCEDLWFGLCLPQVSLSKKTRNDDPCRVQKSNAQFACTQRNENRKGDCRRDGPINSPSLSWRETPSRPLLQQAIRLSQGRAKQVERKEAAWYTLSLLYQHRDTGRDKRSH